MSPRATGLGRGLGALIPTAPVSSSHNGSSDPLDSTDGYAVDLRERADASGTLDSASPNAELSAIPGVTLAEIAVGDIVANPRQPRTVFDPEAIAELAHSLTEVGFLQPVVVRRAERGFELVAGERRWRAAQVAGLATVPALVRDTADDELLRDALLENLHRVQLNPLEEAAAYQQLLTDFGCTQEDLAARIGKSRPAVSNSLRLLRLPPTVQRRVAAGVLTAGHARALVAIDDPDRIEALATRVVVEGMSVRALEEAIALGESGEDPGRRRRRPNSPSPHTAVAEDLSDRLDTRVKVTGGAKRGRIVVEFASPDDLQRILSALRDPATWG